MDVAEDVVSSVKQEANTQGLTSKGASEALGHLSAQISKAVGIASDETR